MNQYCRYCAFCCNGDAYYCTAKEKVLNKSYVRRINKCDEYAMSDLGDVDSGNQYKPRGKKPKSPQLSLWDQGE